MTRWARGSDSNKKKPLEASNWSELKHSKPQGSGSNNIPSSLTKQQKHQEESTKKVYKNKNFSNKKSFKRSSDYEHQKKLKEAFVKSANPQEKEVAEIFWKTERSNQRRIKRIQERQAKKVCYNCRQPGHQVSQCPEVRRDVDQGTGICYKCGSTEHASAQCTAKVKPGTYPFAKCFVCGEMGHITKQCPDNPRGLYPNGGCCKMCGSVEHFKKDCPRLLKQQGVPDVTVDRLSDVKSADDDPSLVKRKASHEVGGAKKRKVVKF